MSGFRVDRGALHQLAIAFRQASAVDLPRISGARTGHAELDAALDDLRSAIETVTSAVDLAVVAQAAGVTNAARAYAEIDTSLTRPSST